MAKASLSFSVTPPKKIVSRQAEAFCSTPGRNMRGWTLDNTRLDDVGGVLSLNPQWEPSNYPYGKDDYSLYVGGAANSSMWIESNGALGKNDSSVGFAAGSGTDPDTRWDMYLSTSHVADYAACRGIVCSFLWYRPADTYFPALEIFPRIDFTKSGEYSGLVYYFGALNILIDSQAKLIIREYPYDNYTAFETNHNSMLQQVYSHPLVINPQDISSQWVTLWIEPLSNDEILIKSNILYGGGFIFRSSIERDTIPLCHSGVPGMRSLYGGLSQVQFCPLDFPTTGTLTSDVIEKNQYDDKYPSLKVFGWSPTEPDNNGYFDNWTVPPGSTNIEGVSYRILDEFGIEIDPVVPRQFKKFKYEITLTGDGTRSPYINDIVLDYDADTEADDSESIDISANVLQFTENISSEIGGYTSKLVIANKDNIYGAIAERPLNEIAVSIQGAQRSVLYTKNIGYDYYMTPTQPALKLEWDCGDGFEYLKRELLVNHPPYDGQVLSDALKEFLSRIGYTSDRIDIEDTPGIILPKKRGKSNYLFKPEDGTTAEAFLKKLAEWFGGIDYVMRFDASGKLTFDTVDDTVTMRTFYLNTETKPLESSLTINNIKVELMHDQFYNEIWVVGEDKVRDKPIFGVYQNLASQTDKNAPDYVGRRLLMVVLTRINKQSDLEKIVHHLENLYGKLRTRISFTTQYDKYLRENDFIKIDGVSHLWRITGMNTDITEETTTQNEKIQGCQITAVQWPLKG